MTNLTPGPDLDRRVAEAVVAECIQRIQRRAQEASDD